ncbi:MAG: CorA family divalent cation transporter [Eubacteriales bacterium]|nr:CorA family divalent cation transporter [Eubacteriales bacterium]
MAINVFILKNSIEKSSVEGFLKLKKELKAMKKQAKKKRIQNADSNQAKVNMAQNEESNQGKMNSGQNTEFKQTASEPSKVRKELRTVFVTDKDSIPEALSLAGIYYEGEINQDDIEFCKIETQQQCLCGNLHIPKLKDVMGEKYKMSFFVNRKNIVIIDDNGFALRIINRIISSRNKPGQSREKFLYNFCIKFMDQDLDNLQKYRHTITQLEEDINENRLEGITDKIATVRKELLILREYYDELRDFGKQLEENENNFFSGKNLEYFGIISDRADRLMGRSMYLLDYVAQIRDSYQGKVAERQNANMEFLTIISTIFFPLTLITGWYGMNFNNMPELANGYPGVIVLSLIVICGVIFIFKKRKIL